MSELRRYNIVSKYAGQAIEYEFEADDNGQVVLADGAVTLVQQLREELQRVYNLVGYWSGEARQSEEENAALRAQVERLSKPVSDDELARYSSSGSRGLMLICSRDVTDLIDARKEQP